MSFSVLYCNCLSLFKNLISNIALPFILFISHCDNLPKLRGVFALLSNKGYSPTDLCQLATPIPVFFWTTPFSFRFMEPLAHSIKSFLLCRFLWRLTYVQLLLQRIYLKCPLNINNRTFLLFRLKCFTTIPSIDAWKQLFLY